MSTQELLAAVKQEILSTTQLPMALDFMASELRFTGGFATAMAKLSHYFTPFQTFVIAEAEKATGKFDFRVGLEILEREAQYRAQGASPQGLFLFQFRAGKCRNRLGPDPQPGGHRGRRRLRRKLAAMDFNRPPASRPDRPGRLALRPQRTLPQDPRPGWSRDGGKTGPLRRERRPHRPGQSQERPALSLRRPRGISAIPPCRGPPRRTPIACSFQPCSGRSSGSGNSLVEAARRKRLPRGRIQPVRPKHYARRVDKEAVGFIPRTSRQYPVPKK